MRFRLLSALALTGALLTMATPALAQTGTCPTSTALSVVQTGGVINVCVTPSIAAPDGYNDLDPTGRPVVTGLRILVLNDGDAQTAPALATFNTASKPPLNAQNVAWLVLPNTTITGANLQNRRLRLVAQALGQDGTVSGRSPLSNPFVYGPVAMSPAAPTGAAVP